MYQSFQIFEFPNLKSVDFVGARLAIGTLDGVRILHFSENDNSLGLLNYNLLQIDKSCGYSQVFLNETHLVLFQDYMLSLWELGNGINFKCQIPVPNQVAASVTNDRIIICDKAANVCIYDFQVFV
jgi:hypothetical protein